MPKSIAIITFDRDPHAHAVAWGLRRLGHNVEFLYFHALQHFHRVTLEYLGGEVHSRFLNLSRPLEEFDTIWVRRAARIEVTRNLSDADATLARLEWEALQNSLLIIARISGCFIVNPEYEKFLAGLKPVQLALAQNVGFKIPHTIISNDPRSISEMIDLHKNVMFKVHGMPSWREGADVFEFGTQLVSSIAGMEADATVSPGIFQEYVEKAYEARVVVIGEEIFCFKILSQSDPSSLIDWRRRNEFTRGIVSLMDCPEQESVKIISLMRKLNITTGSFDFIISSDGSWTFLEVNPSGAFLWLEEDVPEATLLDSFCKFLAADKEEFGGECSGTIHLADFSADAEMLMRKEPTLPHAIHPYVLNKVEDEP